MAFRVLRGLAPPYVDQLVRVDTELRFRLRFRPKLELEIRPLVRLWPTGYGRLRVFSFGHGFGYGRNQQNLFRSVSTL